MPLRLAHLGLALVLAYAALVGLRLIAARGQYPLYGDERHLSTHAWHMVEHGTLRPGFYKYGSLPLYVTAASMATAAQLGRAGGALESLDDVRSVSFPYYVPAFVTQLPRALFLLIGVLGLALAGLCAQAAYGRAELLPLAAAALCCSDWYHRQSWAYLNVDIVAAALSLAALWWAMRVAEQKQPGWSQVAVSAALCGAVAATKYNSALIALPFLLLLGRELRGTGGKRLLGFSALMIAAFLLFEPYSVLDFERFRADVTHEMVHYKTAHAGHEGATGWPQLQRYMNELYTDFGGALTWLGLLGVAMGLHRRRWLTLVLLSFPVALLIFMSMQVVYFPRSVLPAFAAFSVFVAYGALTAMDGVSWAAARVRRGIEHEALRRRLGSALSWTGLVALVLLAGLPGKLGARHHAVTDSRVLLARWLEHHAAARCVLVHPKQIALDPGSLPKRCRSAQFDLERTSVTDALAGKRARISTGETRYVLYAKWSHDRRKPEGAQTAAAWRAGLDAAKLGTPIWQAGASAIWVNYKTIELGDPALSLFDAP